MEINIGTSKDFESCLNTLKAKYGEDFEYLNGLHESQMNFSDFIDAFVGKNVADVTIDANANASSKDIRSLLAEKGKSIDKLFAFNKIFFELKKKYGLRTAKQWLEAEYNGLFYLHDSPSTTYTPYCFHGDTKILTKKGIKPLRELVGQSIEVLNKNHGWENATVQHFGKQALSKLVLTRYGVKKEILVTDNHLWIVRNKKGYSLEKRTSELIPGDRIPFNTSNVWSITEPSPFGIAHGFFTGDGDKGTHRRANFCGDKEALLPYFTPAKINGTDKEKTTTGIPNYFCELPSLSESPSYLLGWLAGYFAADGHIDKHGRCTLASTSVDTLEFVRNVLCVLGMPVNEIRYQDRVSNLTGEEGRIFILTLSEEYLPESFFIRPFHKERITIDKERKDRSWIVESVEETGVIDDVFCAVAENTHTFTLDNNILTHNCYAYDLTRLAKEGLFFLKHYNNEGPKHLTTFIDDVIEFISFMSNRSSGAVGIPNVLVWTMYFLRKDTESGYVNKSPDYYIRQAFQKLIYRLNQPFMRIDQSAFVNMSVFDRKYAEALFGGLEYPDGTFFIDYIEDFMQHQKIFMEVVKEVRKQNMFTFPVLTCSLIYKDGKFEDEEFARYCSDNNCEYNDYNFFTSDSVTSLSNCCRLISDTSRLDAFINSIGGTALSIGSVKVNTINLMRIAYDAKNKSDYLKKLESAALLCCKTLDIVRHIIKRNVEKGLLPNYCDGGVEMSKQYSTVGILGLYEVIEFFGFTTKDEFGNISYTDDGIAFAKQIFEVLNRVKDGFTKDYSFNIESVPAERAAVILCQKDNLLFERHDKFIYSNQWIPLSEKCTIKEKIRLSSILDPLCSGGAIAHINLEAPFANTETAWKMLNYIASNKVFYFAFNIRINECCHHHGFVGTPICPVCGEGVIDSYQRIVGYLVPTRAYSKDRFKEFNTRQWYSHAEMLRDV